MTSHPGGAVTGPADWQQVRKSNLALVLSVIADRAPVSQSSLMTLTGLKKPTISRLVDELHRAGWIRAQGEAQGIVGRPRQLWAPDPRRGLLVSAQISIEQVTTLIVDFAGEIRAERSVAVDVRAWTQDHAFAALGQMITGALEDVRLADGDRRPVLGVALAVPGIVNERGESRYAPGLHWDDEDLGARLRANLGEAVPAKCPMVVDNEANLATLAELKHGPHAGVRSMIYILADRGVGAGVIIDSQLYRGAHRSGGEVGHQTIDMQGPRCVCGKRGCWALYISQETLRNRALEARKAGRSSELWARGRSAGSFDSADVVAAAGRGDDVAAEGFSQLRRYLAAGIGNLVSMYDPEIVVLGGYLRAAFADSLSELRAELDQWLMAGDMYQDLRLQLATLGTDAARWGGVAALLRVVMADPRGSGVAVEPAEI